MSHRHKTLRFDKKLLLSLPRRTSLPLLNNNHALSSRSIDLSIIQQILTSAQKQIQLLRNAEAKYISLLSSLDCGFGNLQQLEQLAFEPHQLCHCEQQPLAFGENQRPNDARPVQVRVAVKRDSCRLLKEKSQSCDMSEWRKKEKADRIEKYKLQEGARNQLISLQGSLKTSQNEDHSEQIQSLLRRKKQLRMESKQNQRFPSEAAKNAIMDKKEKRLFGQNDEGWAFELQLNQLKPAKEAPPVIQLGNVKVLPTQQVLFPSTLKLRPIIEFPTRKTKRRRQAGDTCVLIQQLYEQNINNQSALIEAACRSHRGVRIATRQSTLTSILRLPALR